MPRRLLASFPRPSPVEWALLIAGSLLTVQYSWLLDDAFIYFRYADNLLYLGHGLVYNAGESVEGFSSPLWMLLVLGLRAAGADYWLMVRALGVITFALTWAMLVAVNRRLSPSGSPVVNLPLAFLAVNYSVLCYFTSGIETPLVQAAAVLYALFACHPRSAILQSAVGLTPLLRHELALPWLLGIAAAWRWNRRPPLPLIASGVAGLSAWLAFRVTYYADLLPNTFYLKDTVDLAQGWAYLLDTARPYGLALFLLLSLVALAGWSRGQGRTGLLEGRARLLMIAGALGVAAYVVKIGGDPRHYRYLAFPFVLAMASMGGAAETVLARLRRPRASWAAAAAALGLAAGTFAFLLPRQLGGHPLSSGTPFHMVDGINDAAYHRQRLARPPWGSGRPFEQKDRYTAEAAPRASRPYAEVFGSAWCADIYQRFDARAVHLLGLTDPLLARTDSGWRRPGHKRVMRLGRDVVSIVRDAGNVYTPEAFRRAVVQGKAPAWIEENLPAIESILRKTGNRHGLAENLALVFTFPPRLRVPAPPAALIDPGESEALDSPAGPTGEDP